jgi:hypothetical protein
MFALVHDQRTCHDNIAVEMYASETSIHVDLL